MRQGRFLGLCILTKWMQARRKLALRPVEALALLQVLLLCASGCGGGATGGTPTGTYPLTVTATSGSVSQSQSLTLVVR